MAKIYSPPKRRDPQVEEVEVWAVDILEYERGWGSKVDETIKFSTLTEAEEFTNKFNSKNTEKTVPDWYMVASEPYKVSTPKRR